MRHGKKFNHLSRNASQRKALLMNLAKSLILKKRITTTLAKAKALVRFIEPILTKSKHNTTHSRRVVFSFFQDKEPVKELFSNISQKIYNRPGGYTRVIKLSERRLGDNAELAIIELVDFNEFIDAKTAKQAPKTRRKRSKSTTKATAQPTEPASTPDKEESKIESTGNPKKFTEPKNDSSKSHEVKETQKSQIPNEPASNEEAISDANKEHKVSEGKKTNANKKELPDGNTEDDKTTKD